MPSKAYPNPEEARLVSKRAIARETGMTRQRTSRYLKASRWWTERYQHGPYYDGQVIDVINALAGRPHRPIDPQGQDWLSELLRGGTIHGN